MSHQASLPERLSRALANPNGGVLGLVDELLAVSREQDIQLAWQAGRCQVSFPNSEPPGRIELPLPRSVVRAALARVAVLCNQRSPNSVSPYGGQGEVVVDADPAKAIRATFVNTPEEQSLELASVPLGVNSPRRGRPLAAIVE
jgi:hypothetical protein